MSTMSKHGSRCWEGNAAPMDKVLLIEIISQWTEKQYTNIFAEQDNIN